jgi:hypothetical protein
MKISIANIIVKTAKVKSHMISFLCMRHPDHKNLVLQSIVGNDKFHALLFLPSFAVTKF